LNIKITHTRHPGNGKERGKRREDQHRSAIKIIELGQKRMATKIPKKEGDGRNRSRERSRTAKRNNRGTSFF